MLDVAPGVERGLEIDSADGGVLDGKVDDLADFMLVDAALNSGYERNVQADLSKAIEGSELLFQNVRLAAQDAVGFRVKTIELEVSDGRTSFSCSRNRSSFAIRFPFVLIITESIPRDFAARTKSMISGWMVGSPPEN